MPFKSEKQRKFLYSQKPEIAEEFAAHTTKWKKLPKKVKKKNVRKKSKSM